MATIIQKGDLSATSFSNNNTNAAGGIAVRTDAGSTVAAAIAAAIAAVPNAGDVAKGLVELAVAGNFPQHTNNVDATTPAYVKAAIDAAVAALPGDKYMTGLASYNATTNILTLNMSDSTTVPVDLTGLLSDATANVTTGKVDIYANDGTTLLGYLLPV